MEISTLIITIVITMFATTIMNLLVMTMYHKYFKNKKDIKTDIDDLQKTRTKNKVDDRIQKRVEKLDVESKNLQADKSVDIEERRRRLKAERVAETERKIEVGKKRIVEKKIVVPYTVLPHKVTNYYDNGKIKEKLSYLKGLKEGKSQVYHDNGQLWKEENYKNGLLDGAYVEYYKHGQISQKGTYENGRVEGLWRRYHENGELEYSRVCSMGYPVDWMNSEISKNITA